MNSSWLELSVDVDPEAAEAVSELFARYGYNGGVAIEQPLGPLQGDVSNWEELQGAWIDESRPVSVRTYISDDTEAPEKQRKIEEALWHMAQMRKIGPLQVTERKEEDWANAWKAFYVVLRIGKRTVIKPSWLQYEAKDDDIVLDLDPGMAFGTGYHPTTSLCLIALEDYVKPNTNILDLGSGSGILTISAAKVGGPTVRVFAFDIDDVAVDATRENVAHNGLEGQVEVGKGGTPAAQAYGPYNLIVANILAAVIIDLAKSLHEMLEPGGILIASGIFHERGNDVVAELERVGLSVRENRQEGDWLCLISVREP